MCFKSYTKTMNQKKIADAFNDRYIEYKYDGN